MTLRAVATATHDISKIRSMLGEEVMVACSKKILRVMDDSKKHSEFATATAQGG
jgi:hypothetical protein